jgi:amino acid transporter
MIQQIFRRKTDFAVDSSHSLQRVLGVKDLTLFGIAAIIGGGIFSSIGKACATGGPAVIWLFILSAIACGFAALSYAEFASRIPVSGSAYTYAYATFGELFAWIIGWALLMEYSIGNIYIAFSWSGYFNHLLEVIGLHIPSWLSIDYSTAHRVYNQYSNHPSLLSLLTFDYSKSQYISYLNSHAADLHATTDEIHALKAWLTCPRIAGLNIVFDAPALFINAIITLLVYRGIKESRNASNLMVYIKLLVVVLIIAVGSFYIDMENYTPFMPNGFEGVMAGVSGVFFTYIGFDAVSTLAEESKNPQRDLPRGMFYSLIICTVLYILISLVLTGMVPFELLNVDDPLAFVLGYKSIHWLEYFVSVSAIVAMASVLLVFQMGQPRIWMTMSRDGLLPPAFAKIHPKFKTPSFATIVTGLVVGIPILFTDENFVLDFTSIGTIFAFILVCGGVLLLPPREEKNELIVEKRFKLMYVDAKLGFPIVIATIVLIVLWLFPNYFSSIIDCLFAGSLSFTQITHLLFWLLQILLLILSWKKSLNLIPMLGITTCSFLLTGMTLDNWKWFGIWFTIGLVFYFSYGFRKSKLA